MIKVLFTILLALFLQSCNNQDSENSTVFPTNEDLPKGKVLVDDMVIDSELLFEDHELESLSPQLETHAVKHRKHRKWPKGRLYFRFAKHISKTRQSQFLSICRNRVGQYAKISCRRATASTKHYVLVGGPRGCGGSAYLGYQLGAFRDSRGRSFQKLKVGLDCWRDYGIIEHELLHTLGLTHEHNHPNRNKFVKIYWNNIEKGTEHNFFAIKSRLAKVTRYDFNSVMHYYSHAFSRNGKPTITKLNGDLIPDNTVMSSTDHVMLQRIYGAK